MRLSDRVIYPIVEDGRQVPVIAIEVFNLYFGYIVSILLNYSMYSQEFENVEDLNLVHLIMYIMPHNINMYHII